MGRDVSFDDSFSDEDGASECGKVRMKLENNPFIILSLQEPVYPLRPSLFPNVPPYVQFIPVIN